MFLFGGVLNKFIAVRYPFLMLEIPFFFFFFFLETWAQRGQEGQRDRMEPGWGQGKRLLSPWLAAETGLCWEPAGMFLRGSWEGGGTSALSDEASPENPRQV